MDSGQFNLASNRDLIERTLDKIGRLSVQCQHDGVPQNNQDVLAWKKLLEELHILYTKRRDYIQAQRNKGYVQARVRNRLRVLKNSQKIGESPK